MATIAFLFPDTNLFEQCKPLRELDWSRWDEYAEIRIIVTRPVLEELDEHKSQGNTRRAKRARTASTLFGEIRTGDSDHKAIEVGAKTIKILLDIRLDPDEELRDKLNYKTRDGRLIGIVGAFAKEHASSWFVTDDTIPKITADAVNVPVFSIPENWLLDRESSDEEKRISRLEAEVEKLRHIEPKVSICCVDANGNQLDDDKRLHMTAMRFLPLTDEELSELMASVEDRFPIATNFQTPKPDDIAQAEETLGTKVTYVPPEPKAIEKYKKEYRRWLSGCDRDLRNFHRYMQAINKPPTCTFVGVNEGSRPAKDVLATFEAKGRFQLADPEYVSEEGIHERKYLEPSFKPPPEPLVGKWEVTHITAEVRRLSDMLTRAVNAPDLAHNFMGIGPHLLDDVPYRDPNEFSWVEGSRTNVLSSECEQWRHGDENRQRFEIAVHGAIGESFEGLILCTLQAENLTNPTVHKLPVRLDWEDVSVLKRASELVREFVDDA